MSNNVLVVGRVICKAEPVVGADVKVTLLFNVTSDSVSKFSETVTTDSNGRFIAAFDTEEQAAEMSHAKIEITCEDGDVIIGKDTLEWSSSKVGQAVLKFMISRLASRVLEKLIGFSPISPLLTTEFALRVNEHADKQWQCCSWEDDEGTVKASKRPKGEEDARQGEKLAEGEKRARRESRE